VIALVARPLTLCRGSHGQPSSKNWVVANVDSLELDGGSEPDAPRTISHRPTHPIAFEDEDRSSTECICLHPLNKAAERFRPQIVHDIHNNHNSCTENQTRECSSPFALVSQA
jgi:hypothetical protein